MLSPRTSPFFPFLALALAACSTRTLPQVNEVAKTSLENENGAIGKLTQHEPITSIAVEADDAQLGNGDAQVTVVAFLDYQCSFCAEGFETLLKLRQQFNAEELRIVFKHLPLRSHPQAIPAATAAQAVQELAGSDAFFQFSKLAFAHQSELSFPQLRAWAEEVGVPRDLFDEAFYEELTLRRVAQDAAVAHRAGVRATPTFFVNGYLVAGAQDLEFFQQVIYKELEAMQNAEGDNWASLYQERVNKNMKGSLIKTLLAEDPHDYLLSIDESPVLGPKEAPVTVVLFTDFECPFCKRADKTVISLQEKYKKKVRFVFKHLPLTFHAQARPAALLSSAIHQYRGEKAFWEASHRLFELSPNLTHESLIDVGLKSGLSKKEAENAIAGKNNEGKRRLQKDQDLADDVLARGTPHFFINGKRLSGARPQDHFEALIEHQLERASALLAGGVAPIKLYETMQQGARSPGAPQKISLPVPSVGRPRKGPKTAPVVIHIFSDFECPYCRRGEQNLTALGKLYPAEFSLVWHNTPLSFHERARPAARAAHEAYLQKGSTGFWLMHEALFGLKSSAPELEREQILHHGQSIGLDPKKLKVGLDSNKHDEAIDQDIQLADSLGIHGTPAYVIGDYLVTGAKPLSYLQRILKLALKESLPAKSSAK